MQTHNSLLWSLALVAACGGEPISVPASSGATGKFASGLKIMTFLDGKTLTMDGAAIPSHPNGFDENTNFGSATQCYMSVTMRPQAGRIQVVSQLGTVEGAAMTGQTGRCNHEMLSAELTFDSTAVLIENVADNGKCFDFTVTYPGFGQEGRGSISEDGTKLVLELFFKDQAVGHRCAQGEVGAATVTLNQAMFTGRAEQTYTISE